MGKQRRDCVAGLIHAVRGGADGLQRAAGAPHAPGRPAERAAELCKGRAGLRVRPLVPAEEVGGRGRPPEGARGRPGRTGGRTRRTREPRQLSCSPHGFAARLAIASWRARAKQKQARPVRCCIRRSNPGSRSATAGGDARAVGEGQRRQWAESDEGDEANSRAVRQQACAQPPLIELVVAMSWALLMPGAAEERCRTPRLLASAAPRALIHWPALHQHMHLERAASPVGRCTFHYPYRRLAIVSQRRLCCR